MPFAATIGLASHLGAHLLTRLGSRLVGAGGLLVMALGAFMLASVPSHAHYAGNLLPAFIVLGIGTGLSFVTASVTAMNDVEAERAGTASGLLTTRHEFGGALGVAVLSAVSTSAGVGVSQLRIGQGHHAGFLAAGALASALALLAAVVLRPTRPAVQNRMSIH